MSKEPEEPSWATVDLDDFEQRSRLRRPMLERAGQRIAEDVKRLQSLGIIGSEGQLLHPDQLPVDMQPDSKCTLD